MTASIENKSGIRPVEFRVLIKQRKVEEKTRGGIFLPQDSKEKEQLAEMKATVIAVGGSAFSDWIQTEGGIPKVGDEILTARYAGVYAEGVDGEEYRIINDKDVTAILEEK